MVQGHPLPIVEADTSRLIKSNKSIKNKLKIYWNALKLGLINKIL